MSEFNYTGPSNITWTNDFTASYNPEDKRWTGSHSYTCLIEEVASKRPNSGDRCVKTGFTFLVIDSYTVNNISGGIAQVTCTYGGVDPTEDSTTDEEQTGDQAVRDNDGWEVSLKVGYDEAPIKDHPHFKDTPEKASIAYELDRLSMINDFSNGQLKISPVSYGPAGGVSQYINFLYDINRETEKYKTCACSVSEINYLMDIMSSGFNTYNKFRCIVTRTKDKITTPLSTEARNIGYIDDTLTSADIPTLPEDHYWIFAGVNQTEYMYTDPSRPGMVPVLRYRFETEHWSQYIPKEAKPVFTRP